MGAKKKQQPSSIANSKITNLQNMIDSDSDSYGSEGKLKEKEVIVKKRGGKKRNKLGELVSMVTGDLISEFEMDTQAQTIPNDLQDINMEINSLQQEESKVEVLDEVVQGTGSSADQKSEIVVLAETVAEDQENSARNNQKSNVKTECSNGYKPIRRRNHSPPMIQEHDPNEDSAKVRAKKRADAIKQKKETFEIDKSLYPDHPAPWKGRPSDFFILHEPRRGDTKVLNNSQQEFILVYYPDSAVDQVSLMEFLYTQAKNHEDKERWAIEQNAREAEIIRGRTKKKSNKRKPQKASIVVKELAHVNKQPRDMTRDGNQPMSFESLLEGNPEEAYRGPDFHSISTLRTTILDMTTKATNNFTTASRLEMDHTTSVAPSLGYCPHCQHHGMHIAGINTMTVNEEHEVSKQQILMQICEAKKRQARMEAENARRLRDEAHRLAEQAHILELEAQRPLLEAQKLELEARQLEAQIGRIPEHLMSRSQIPQQQSLQQIATQHRSAVDNRKKQLIDESRNTQNEIRRLQDEAQRLQQQILAPPKPKKDDSTVQLNKMIATLQNITGPGEFVASKNSIAARNAADYKVISKPRAAAPKQAVQVTIPVKKAAPMQMPIQAPAAQHRRASPVQQAQPPPSRKVQIESEDESEEEPPMPAPKKVILPPKQPKKEQHDYSYGEEDSEIDNNHEDPLLQAANKEFEQARKQFEAAQKLQAKIKKKNDDRVKHQQEDIEQAQEQTKKYFEEEKKRKEDQSKMKRPKELKESQAIEAFKTNQAKLLDSFNDYIKRIKQEHQGINHRYNMKTDVQDFLLPILNGKIFREFDEKQGYINFSQFYLDDNFRNGHQDYFHKWRHLFLYETYSFLMNTRWSKFTGNQIEIKNMIKQSQEKTMCWKGYFQYEETKGKLGSLKMFKEPPNIHQYSFKNKNYSKIYDDPDRPEGQHFDLNHCREDDLIILSKFRINLEGHEDIKMVSGGVKFIKEVISKPGVIFGYVARANTKSDNFVEIQIDSKHASGFQTANNEEGSNIFTRYCYFFESVLTSLREFRALKAVEFTRLAPTICYPSLALDYKDQMIDNYASTVEVAFGSLDSGPDMHPKDEVEPAMMQDHMNKYLLINHNKYNKSQCQVLEQIIEMPKDNIMLIQGPPGTGKTHTIIGIISMIMGTRLANSRQKIMVCAPSNAAIDQIVQRIIDKGLIGLRSLKKAQEEENKKNVDVSSDSDDYELPDLTQTLIRITGAEYTVENSIKKHTLDQRIIKKLCIEKFGDLKKCIKDLKDMIHSMNNYEDWDDNDTFPYVQKAKFVAYTKNLKYLKSVRNWGDQNLSRQQQLQAMEAQLKMHNSELNEFKQGTNIHQGNNEWKEAERAIIQESSIVCCTLSMAGSSKLDKFRDRFEYLIIDEACQSTEPSTMIPFVHAPKRVILVGDQKQLPATTFSGNSEQTGYCKSLFERLLDAGFDKTMLTIQFRMHPKIRAFPSEQFYGGAITDHPSIGTRVAPQQIQNLADIFPSRIMFFDIQDSDEVFDNKSKCNLEEADFTRILVDFIARKSSLQGTLKYIQGKIGVISPYKAQVKQLFSRLEKLCSDQGCSINETLEVNTVDAFQGSEKDIIIFNCVRSNFETIIEKSLGFLLDERRLNVAITRPKFFLMVVGNSKTLKKSGVWENMINYCQVQGSLINVQGRWQYDSMADFKKHILPQFIE